jgi:hypothetical protein
MRFPGGSGSGGGSLTVTSVKTTDYTAATGQLVRVDPTSGEVEITLPAAAGATVIAIKNQSASGNNILVTPNGSDTVEGLTSYSFAAARGFITLYSDGVSDWMVS